MSEENKVKKEEVLSDVIGGVTVPQASADIPLFNVIPRPSAKAGKDTGGGNTDVFDQSKR